MNLLQPQIIKIGTRRYRKNPYMTATMQNEYQTNAPYEEETVDMYLATATSVTKSSATQSCGINNEYNDEACCIEKPDEEDYAGIELSSNGAFQCTLDVSESYFGFIIGKNGEKKMNLERETSTRIKIPPKSKGGEFLSIEGKTKASVASCRTRLNIIISTARHRNPFTHFLSCPLNFEDFKAKHLDFKAKVLQKCSGDRGIDATIFQNEHKLHLTVCTLTLISDAEIDQAYGLLDECRDSFIKELLVDTDKEITVHITGETYIKRQHLT